MQPRRYGQVLVNWHEGLGLHAVNVENVPAQIDEAEVLGTVCSFTSCHPLKQRFFFGPGRHLEVGRVSLAPRAVVWGLALHADEDGRGEQARGEHDLHVPGLDQRERRKRHRLAEVEGAAVISKLSEFLKTVTLPCTFWLMT